MSDDLKLATYWKAEYHHVADALDSMKRERDEARAERDRLREALKRVASEGTTRHPEQDLEHVQNIAREALATGED
jgi:hypothetical protein